LEKITECLFKIERIQEHMKILVTNDDGIESPGLWALAGAMSRIGETLVVAPDKQQSGVGTSISLHSGMSVNEVSSPAPGIRAYSVGGTPSDCVTIALRRLAQGHIDFLVSGINHGANVGNDIHYSGTVMATLQGYFRKLPSMAVSLAAQDPEEVPLFDVAAKVAELLMLNITKGKMPTGAIFNTNIPNIPLEKIQGIVTTRTASSGYVKLSELQGSDTISYRRGVHNIAELNIEQGTDLWAISNGLVSVTPLRPAFTDHDLIPVFTEHISALESDFLSTGFAGNS